jgi:hypothetical protein
MSSDSSYQLPRLDSPLVVSLIYAVADFLDELQMDEAIRKYAALLIGSIDYFNCLVLY